ncbi:ECF-type sigma factor [Aeoliella straminimaris]|uniref:ECF-type sigma factor n=1 Tax=Aeoliella straminimaris TaxID=2954799 RepID=UPI0031345E9B
MLSSLFDPTGANESQPVVDGGTETHFGDRDPVVDVTQILSRIEAGDSNATEQLLPPVYDELRKLAAAKLAHEKRGQTWQPTVLVHEACVRLVKSDKPQQWNGRGHFFAAAAEAMRRILIENARQKKSQKRGGRLQREELVEVAIDDEHSDCLDLLALDEALTELEARWPVKAAVVKLRYFAGLTTQQTAQALGVSRATAERHWTFARTWLYAQLQGRG